MPFGMKTLSNLRNCLVRSHVESSKYGIRGLKSIHTYPCHLILKKSPSLECPKLNSSILLQKYTAEPWKNQRGQLCLLKSAHDVLLAFHREQIVSSTAPKVLKSRMEILLKLSVVKQTVSGINQLHLVTVSASCLFFLHFSLAYFFAVDHRTTF